MTRTSGLRFHVAAILTRCSACRPGPPFRNLRPSGSVICFRRPPGSPRAQRRDDHGDRIALLHHVELPADAIEDARARALDGEVLDLRALVLHVPAVHLDVDVRVRPLEVLHRAGDLDLVLAVEHGEGVVRERDGAAASPRPPGHGPCEAHSCFSSDLTPVAPSSGWSDSSRASGPASKAIRARSHCSGTLPAGDWQCMNASDRDGRPRSAHPARTAGEGAATTRTGRLSHDRQEARVGALILNVNDNDGEPLSRHRACWSGRAFRSSRPPPAQQRSTSCAPKKPQRRRARHQAAGHRRPRGLPAHQGGPADARREGAAHLRRLRGHRNSRCRAWSAARMAISAIRSSRKS